MLTALFLVVGFILLWRGGDLLVDGADAFARSYGVPPTLAGVFILGFGTSMPELAVSALAALEGEAGIAVGNVVGSNIANVALVLGIAAVIGVVHVNRFLFKVEMPVCILASILGFALLRDGSVDRTDGLILLAAFAAYLGFALGTVRHRDIEQGERPPKRPWFDLGKTALALAAVLGGAELFKTGAIDLAETLGVPKVVIGSTLVALATSLPELATAIAAARAHKADLVLGNIIGSNIFNLLLVLGTAGVLADQIVDPSVPQVLVPLMLALAIFPLLVAAIAKRTIGHAAGILMLLAYAAFLAYSTWAALR
jgi:cation:H+ antiporter